MNLARTARASLVLTLITLGACATSPDTSPSLTTTSPIAHPTGAGEAVVQIASGGGLIPMQVAVSEIPEWTLYGDGTIVWLAPAVDPTAPPPAVPDLRQKQVPPDTIDALLEQAEAEGMLSDRRLSASEATDLWTTTVSISANGRDFQNSVYALGFDPDEGAPLPPADQAGSIAQVQSFIDLAEDPAGWSPSVTEPRPYRAEAWKVWAFPSQAPPESADRAAKWPLRPTFLAGVPDEGRCTVVTDGDLAELRAATAGTSVSTPWRSRTTGDRRFNLVIVPVLPGQDPTCPI